MRAFSINEMLFNIKLHTLSHVCSHLPQGCQSNRPVVIDNAASSSYACAHVIVVGASALAVAIRVRACNRCRRIGTRSR
jgi:hypothetical protein